MIEMRIENMKDSTRILILKLYPAADPAAGCIPSKAALGQVLFN
jgi:hypothetical protein